MNLFEDFRQSYTAADIAVEGYEGMTIEFIWDKFEDNCPLTCQEIYKSFTLMPQCKVERSCTHQHDRKLRATQAPAVVSWLNPDSRA